MRILFLCDGNACRSQLAAAYTKKYYSEYQVFSAGIAPCKEIHWKTRAIAWEIGIELVDAPKHWSVFQNETFDLVVSFSERAACEVPWKSIYFPVIDPQPEGSYEQFIRTREEVIDAVENVIHNCYLPE